MPRLLPSLALGVLLLAGCTSVRTPTTATRLEPAIQAQVERGLVEPGFTPEMVYLALGQPSEPAEGLADATRDGTWVYRDFRSDSRGFVPEGHCRRIVHDPKRRKDTIVTERIAPEQLAQLSPRSVHIAFRDGRVTEIRRAGGEQLGKL